jgi:transcription elongation factor Elf1
MNCSSEQIDTCNLKVEGDVGADPIWCDLCGHNLDIEEIPLSK